MLPYFLVFFLFLYIQNKEGNIMEKILLSTKQYIIIHAHGFKSQNIMASTEK